jgi:Uma2 family endonuclease
MPPGPTVANLPDPTVTAADPSLTLGDLYRLSVDEYEQMGRAGLLEDARVELIDGFLVCKMPKNPQHASAVRMIHRRLLEVVPEGWSAFKEDPIRIPDLSEPEPDVAIVRADPNEYRERHPGPDDIALVVEAADTSLMRDRTDKMAIYAASGLPVYWLVNLIDGRLEVYSEPEPDQRIYKNRRDFGRDESVTLTIEGRELGQIRISDLLP